MIVLGFIYFLLLVLMVLFFPGRFILRKSNIEISDPLIRLPLEIGIGTSFFITGMYFLSWIHSQFIYFIILLPVLYFEFEYLRKQPKKSHITFPFIESLIILLGSLLALYITGRSGHEINGQLFFYGVNASDAVFHISLIGNLIHHFPPTHAGMSGIALHGYNFLYDLLVASFAKFFFLNPFDLFFRYFSLFVAIFYGLSCFALGKFLKMDTVSLRFFLFLAYFVQGAIFIFTFLGIAYDPGIVQPLANIVDPSVLLSVSLFFLSFILVFSVHSKSQLLVASVMIAVLPMIKIYTAFLFFAALGVIMLLGFIQNKKEKWIYSSLLILAGIIGGSMYAPINLGVGKLIFTPFLFFTHFMESFAAINKSDWWLRMLVYFEHNNYIRIVQNYSILLALFFIPTLGIRIISIVFIKNVFKKNFYSYRNIFLMSAVLVGILLPTFFIQNIAVFVIIQFLWIIYFFLLIPTAYGLSYLHKRLPQVGKIILIIFVIGISLPDLFTLLKMYSINPVIVSSSTVAVAKEVKHTLAQDDRLVVLDSGYGVPLISAISEHDVYYEPEVLEFTGLNDEVTKRKTIISKMNELLLKCSGNTDTNSMFVTLLKEAGSTYLMTLHNKPCLQKLPSFTLVSRKGEAALYKLR